MKIRADKFTPLTDLDWVRLAVSEDRPALHGIQVADGQMVTTDGHRLHVAPASPALRDGLWDARTLVPMTTTFPAWSHLVPGEPTLTLGEAVACWAIVQAAIVALRLGPWLCGPYVTMRHYEAQVALDPSYLADALRGAPGWSRAPVDVTLAGTRDPVKLTFPGTGRIAVLMPVKMDDPAPSRFDLSEYLTPIPAAAREPALAGVGEEG